MQTVDGCAVALKCDGFAGAAAAQGGEGAHVDAGEEFDGIAGDGGA